MKKRNLLIALVCVMALTATLFTGCGGGSSDGDTYELTWAGIGATDATDTWIGEEIAARVNEQTDGAVTINVYPASQLGDLDQAYDEIMKGNIDMGLFTIYGTYDSEVEILYLPFLTTNYEEFAEVYAVGGDVYNSMQAIQDTHGVTLLGFWGSGYLGLGFANLSDASQATLYDFTAKKNELVRVPGMDSMIQSCEAMGYNTTVIAYADVYTSLQTGVCDGSWNGGPYANYMSFRDVLNYYVDYKCCNDVYSLVMNTEKLESMPEEYQEIIKTVSAEVLQEALDRTEAEEAQAIEDMKAAGITVFEPTAEERAAMQAYFKENVWPQFTDLYDPELLDKLMAE